MRKTMRWVAAVVVVGALSTATACLPEPRGLPREADIDSISISSNSDSYEQVALSHVLLEAYFRNGRQVYLAPESNSRKNPRIDRLQQGEVDLVVGCTGELLNMIDPQLAAQLSKKYVAAKAKGIDPNDGQWRDDVYEAMVSALPSSLMATDPSNATGCANYTGPELPQNIVPVFRESALKREDREVLNKVTGGITSEDVVKLQEGPRNDESTKERARQLLVKLGI